MNQERRNRKNSGGLNGRLNGAHGIIFSLLRSFRRPYLYTLTCILALSVGCCQKKNKRTGMKKGSRLERGGWKSSFF